MSRRGDSRRKRGMRWPIYSIVLCWHWDLIQETTLKFSILCYKSKLVLEIGDWEFSFFLFWFVSWKYSACCSNLEEMVRCEKRESERKVAKYRITKTCSFFSFSPLPCRSFATSQPLLKHPSLIWQHTLCLPNQFLPERSFLKTSRSNRKLVRHFALSHMRKAFNWQRERSGSGLMQKLKTRSSIWFVHSQASTLVDQGSHLTRCLPSRLTPRIHFSGVSQKMAKAIGLLEVSWSKKGKFTFSTWSSFFLGEKVHRRRAINDCDS